MEDKINLTPVKKKLLNYFKNHKEVLFAYILGSQITNKTNKFSDIDIAIFIDKIKINDELYRYGYQAKALSFA